MKVDIFLGEKSYRSEIMMKKKIIRAKMFIIFFLILVSWLTNQTGSLSQKHHYINVTCCLCVIEAQELREISGLFPFLCISKRWYTAMYLIFVYILHVSPDIFSYMHILHACVFLFSSLKKSIGLDMSSFVRTCPFFFYTCTFPWLPPWL